jgi:hypothetical protein
MTMVHRDGVDEAQGLMDRIDRALRELQQRLPVLVALLPEPDTGGPRTGTIGRYAPEGSEPWNSAVADAIWAPWFGAGTLVQTMRYSLGMAVSKVRPYGTDALDTIAKLAPACAPEVLKLVVLRLERWVRRADALPAIDEAEPWVALPARPGGAPPSCPYCGTLALRMRKREGEVRCFFPDCEDGDGKPTRARMEPGRMTGEARLVFGDGTMMTFEGDDDA